jgi:type IV pilus assembly protein PilA
MAIALPSFLNQASRARESEATHNLGAIFRAQQVYRLQHQSFAKDLKDLDATVLNQTPNFTYRVVLQSNAKESVVIIAEAQRPNIASFSGIVVMDAKENFTSGICRTEQPSPIPPAAPIPPAEPDGKIVCPKGSSLVE